MKVEDIEYVENGIKITLAFDKKTESRRQFLINEGEDFEVNLIEIVKNYKKLRPANVPTSRFFINYRDGKCKRQPIGINTIGGCPQKIATFLKLPFANEYTGHCFKRTSTVLLSGSTILRNWCSLHHRDLAKAPSVKTPSVSYTISSVSEVSNTNDYDNTNGTANSSSNGMLHEYHRFKNKI